MPLIVLLLLALAVGGCDRQIQTKQQGEQALAGPVKGIDRTQRGKPAPAVVFTDPDGEETSLADVRGTPVLVNLWATWCAPCVKELPTLEQLAASRSARGRNLRVIAISQDKAPQGSVEAFLDAQAISRLGAHHDPDMTLSAALGVEVLPTTLLFDAQGREVWRYVGDLDWTGAEAERLLAEGLSPEAAR